MSWKTIAAAATPDTLDDLEQLLWDAGAVSVTVEDAGGEQEQPLFEPGPGETPLWDRVVVTGLFEDDVDSSEIRETLAVNDFSFLYADELGDRVWEREWLNRFSPMKFGERLWVCPTGHEVPETSAIVINLDPGLAFGTGTHATTHLCLEWLDGHLVPGQRVVDYGCGSGILGIAALLLGASHVVAVDNDRQALAATWANAERNGVEDRLAVHEPDQVPPGTWDVVIANILAQPLIELSSRLQSMVAVDGSIVLSGVMFNQVAWVENAYGEIEFDHLDRRDDWVCLHGRKR